MQNQLYQIEEVTNKVIKSKKKKMLMPDWNNQNWYYFYRKTKTENSKTLENLSYS